MLEVAAGVAAIAFLAAYFIKSNQRTNQKLRLMSDEQLRAENEMDKTLWGEGGEYSQEIARRAAATLKD